MEKPEDVATILTKLDLHDIEEIITQPYHKTGPGRPPRSPRGIFKALIVKLLRNITSDRELYRRLWNDEALREICDIEEHEKPYHPSQLTRFRDNVGPDKLEEIMRALLVELVEGGIVRGETLALDATFIKAWSRRDQIDDSRGHPEFVKKMKAFFTTLPRHSITLSKLHTDIIQVKIVMDIVEIQAAYYMVAATGVLIAAVFYMLNLRISQRNQELMLKAQEQNLETRKIGLLDSIATRVVNQEGYRHFFELLRYEWRDYEDFEKKYGTENNPDSAAKRYSLINSYNFLGIMLINGLVEAEDLFDIGVSGAIMVWVKYKPIIEEGRRRYFGKGYYKGFEFLASEMLRVTKEKDPSFVFPEETLDKYVSDK